MHCKTNTHSKNTQCMQSCSSVTRRARQLTLKRRKRKPHFLLSLLRLSAGYRPAQFEEFCLIKQCRRNWKKTETIYTTQFEEFCLIKQCRRNWKKDRNYIYHRVWNILLKQHPRMSLFLKQQPDVEIEKKKATTRCGDQEESNNQMWRSRRKQQPDVAIKKKATTRCGDQEESDNQMWRSRRKQRPDVAIKKKATTRCGDQEESDNQMWRSRRRKQPPDVSIKKKKATTRCEQGHQIDGKKIQSLPICYSFS